MLRAFVTCTCCDVAVVTEFELECSADIDSDDRPVGLSMCSTACLDAILQKVEHVTVDK